LISSSFSFTILEQGKAQSPIGFIASLNHLSVSLQSSYTFGRALSLFRFILSHCFTPSPFFDDIPYLSIEQGNLNHY